MNFLFVVILLIYEILNYMLFKAWRWTLPSQYHSSIVLLCIYMIISHLTIILALINRDMLITKISFIWLFYFVYGLILAFIGSIIYLIMKNYIPSIRQIIIISAYCILILLTIVGYYNAYTTKIVDYTVQINKPLDKPVKIALVSDIHLGTFVGKNHLNQLNHLLSEQKPDNIFIAGDIYDDTLTGFHQHHLSSYLTKLSTIAPTYAILGNHDFAESEMAMMTKQLGIQVLTDDIVETDQFVLIGRRDSSIARNRQSIAQLYKQLTLEQQQLPVIVMDHNPDDIVHAKQLPIDLQLSGHTHNGQLWPFNMVVNKIFEVAYGNKVINETTFITSSGYGFWGMPFRIGSQSEIVMITIIGNK